MENFVLRDQDLFLVANKEGQLDPTTEGAGLYTKDTRFLSANTLLIDGEKPKLLSKQAQACNLTSFRYLHEVPDRGAIEIIKEPLIYDGCYYEKITFTNYFPQEKGVQVSMEFAADFQDMFLVRGFREGKVGVHKGVEHTGNGLLFSYKGLDDLVRKTRIELDSGVELHPGRASILSEAENKLHFSLSLNIKESKNVILKVVPMFGDEENRTHDYDSAKMLLEKKYKDWYASLPQIEADDPIFMNMYQQAVDDIQMLTQDLGYGNTTVAGVPWYAVPFGRDSIITALFMLGVDPEIARSTLKTLAKYQGTERNPEKDEEPGKIMHELRFGELSTTGQTPFTPYYGTVDATALFLILAVEYYQWTKNKRFIEDLRPNLDAALQWIRQKESEGQNPFIQYQKNAEKGIPNQGWKDSSNSIVHQDGSFGASPIALVEVQGYVYAAKKGLSEVYKDCGFMKESRALASEASEMMTRIEKAFWIEESNFYALAIDGNNDQVRSITSNVGHLLLADVNKQSAIVDRLFQKGLNSGYGVRTMSSEEVGYYPMSYHNGSVWPHDNGMILLGLQKHNYPAETKELMQQLLEASMKFPDQRLPELYCGYGREGGRSEVHVEEHAKNRGEDLLVPYPTTCSPQAWAAATAILFVQLLSGVKPNGATKSIHVAPNLLDSMNYMTIKNMRIGEGILSLSIFRTEDGQFTYDVLENTTGWKVVGDIPE